MSNIKPVIIPKWGLTMEEGTISEWLVDVGTPVTVGMELLNIDTDKLTNAVEAADAGVLRRILHGAGETLPVKTLIGILADADTGEAEIDAFIAAWVPPSADEVDE